MHNPGRVIGNSKGKEVSKAKIFKGKYEPIQTIPEVWGGREQIKKKN